MIKMNKTLKGLMSLLVALAVAMTLSVGLFASAAEGTETETVVVTQVITENTTPQRTSYTYVLTPKRAENPMPEGTKDGKYTFGPIDGATTDTTAPTFTLEIDATKVGTYEYLLERVETTPEGDTVSPDSHIFGYKVTTNEKGEIVVIPYVCQSGEPVFSDPDENGYPTKLTLPNTITGTPNTTKSTTSTTSTTAKGNTTRTVTTARSGTAGTTKTNIINRTVNRAVNTGDPYQIGLWIGLIALAGGGMIFAGYLRQKKENEEDEN